ncbi:MAG: Ppx/GppA family phosphatase [Propionibacteriaceae bacterium]|nr:Ppx/GppA family phosphatase [Propionibacteriaceae bacterium]
MRDLYAGVDCGTNSVRMLLVESVAGKLVELNRRMFITRLGQGVDATGELSPLALERTSAAFADFAAEIESYGGAKTQVVATAAARDAKNAEDFFDLALSAFGVPAQILSGTQEAELSFLGAEIGLPDTIPPKIVMDIGGGSTELIQADSTTTNPTMTRVSLNMGSVRIRERFFAADPPTPTQILAAQAFINELLDDSGIAFDQAATWIGVGGTPTSLSALAQELPTYDSTLVHGSQLELSVLNRLTAQLLELEVAQVAAFPTMQPGRADVICAGALICCEIGKRIQLPLTVSETDILDGMIHRLHTS